MGTEVPGGGAAWAAPSKAMKRSTHCVGITAWPREPGLYSRTEAGVTVRILLVEDNALFSESLGVHLAAGGLQRRGGAEALNAATREEPDLVLLDVALPDLSGVEVCRRLRSFSQAPVVFLTARRQ